MPEAKTHAELEFYELQIAAITELAAGFKLIVFEQEQEQVLSYKAGQFLTFVQTYQGKEIRRSYSIASSPALDEPLAIGVKRQENGIFSRQLVDHAKPGDTLQTTGSAGFFTLPENLLAYRQIFLLAAGSGITSLYSLLKTILFAFPEIQVILIYSNSSPETTAFRESLLELKTQFKERLQLEFLYSNSADLKRARLHRELLHQFINHYRTSSLEEILCYVCGPLNYMRMCHYILRQAHIPAGNIRRESFNLRESPPPPLLPPDTDMHQVTLHVRQQTYELQVQYPESILKAARKAGANLPFSCESGRCGNCVVYCTQGTVWMNYNEVLTEKDLQKGLVLTCTGYPIGGDVVVELP